MNLIKIEITGPAGSGKTTIMRALAAILSEQGVRVEAVDDVGDGSQVGNVIGFYPSETEINELSKIPDSTSVLIQARQDFHNVKEPK